MNIDRTSQTWATIEAWLKEAIEVNRNDLERYVPNANYDLARGRIQMAREILKLGEPKRVMMVDKAVTY